MLSSFRFLQRAAMLALQALY